MRLTILLISILVLSSCCEEKKTAENKSKYLHPDNYLKYYGYLDFSDLPLIKDEEFKYDTSISNYLETGLNDYYSQTTYRHSRYLDNYVFLLFFNDYTSALFIADTGLTKMVEIASHSGDGGDFNETTCYFRDSFTIEKTSITGYVGDHIGSGRDTIMIDKKVVTRIKLSRNGNITVTDIDSTFNYIDRIIFNNH